LSQNDEKLIRFLQLISEFNSLPELVIAAGLDPSADLINADLSGISLVGADLGGYNLSGANLDRANLKGAFLGRTNLSGANLSHARLDRANLSGAILSKAKLSQTRFVGANLRASVMAHANLEDADLEGADLRGADLTGASLHRARLGRVDLRGAQLSGAILSEASLRCADLRNTYMRGANLTQAKLDGANLSNANLTKANLSFASLQRTYGHRVDLSESVLHSTNFCNADLSAANFSRTQFEDPQLHNTLVAKTFFIGSRGLSESQQFDLEARGAIFSEDYFNDTGFTQNDIESRIYDLESSVIRLDEWAEELRIKVRLLKSPLPHAQVVNAEVLKSLANEIQASCVNTRRQIQIYRESLNSQVWTSEELTDEYFNINEQLIKIGNFIRVVQIILVDVPGFIARSI
jgi:uncharacterized protein YjbI with pentapeptide repeats